MTQQRKLPVAQSSMTAERLQSIGAAFLISLEQLKQLLPSPLLERVNMLGRDGKESMTAITDTLTQWFDTLPPKEKAKFWTLTLDFFMLPTPHGTPSRGSNF